MVGFPDGSALIAAARARADPDVELALLRAYGLDVTDPDVDLRRIHLALTHLPMGAWPDPEHAASWSTTDHLLAALIDAVRENTYVTALAAGAKHVRKPEPCYRPGGGRHRAARGGGQKVAWADLAGFLMGGGPGG